MPYQCPSPVPVLACDEGFFDLFVMSFTCANLPLILLIVLPFSGAQAQGADRLQFTVSMSSLHFMHLSRVVFGVLDPSSYRFSVLVVKLVTHLEQQCPDSTAQLHVEEYLKVFDVCSVRRADAFNYLEASYWFLIILLNSVICHH